VARSDDSQNSGVGVAEATGDLVKSMARFSLAMGLFAARETVRFFSAPGKAAGSIDDVTAAAGDQLTGFTRTAFAVGANIQHGLIDAALDAVGIGPRGQEPRGATSGLSMSLAKSATRRLTGIRTVGSGALDRAVPQAELRKRLHDYHDEAASSRSDREQLVVRLWKSEGLATTVAKHLLSENTLNDPALLREMLPVVHVGFGSGSAEFHLFDAEKLNQVFSERCATNYREFAYEGIGAILRAYERGLFKLSAGVLGFIPLDAADGPDAADFFAGYLNQFPPGIQRLVVHGYGRLLAFSTPDVYTAIRKATTFPHERIEPLVHGIAFAFVMMNNTEVPLLLRESAVPFEPAVRAAFQNGLIYSIAFMDWYVPGVLADWEPEGRLEADLVEHARREAGLATERGFPLAFRLANPRT